MKQRRLFSSLLVVLTACQSINAGGSLSDVVKNDFTEKESDNVLTDNDTSNKCSLVIPKEIKETVPEDMQYFVFLQAICNLVRTEYVKNMGDGEVTEKLVAGLLASLDPHSSYLDEKAFTALMNQTNGEFGGIGIEMIVDDGFVRVIAPIDDTPAYKAGLKSGDLIIYIDDECISGITAEEAMSKLRGKPNSKVKLKIKRNEKVPFDVVLTRDLIKIQSVKTEVLNNIGYVRISTFDKNTSKDLKNFINKNKQLDGIILDVRDNPGGLLDEAIAVSNIFLSGGKIVSTRGRQKQNTKEFFADPTDLTNGVPIVVLINNGTASAPEIMAGALRDNRRAILVGVRSFGKGSVQKVIPLSEKSAIRLTIAKHYTPNGECIQANGITPDIEADYALVKKFKHLFIVREEFFNNALDVQKNAKHKKLTDANNKKSLDEISKEIDEKKHRQKDEEENDPELLYRKMSLKERAEQDYQLNTAFMVLKAISKYKGINHDTKETK